MDFNIFFQYFEDSTIKHIMKFLNNIIAYTFSTKLVKRGSTG